jgi:hypothetical protein
MEPWQMTTACDNLNLTFVPEGAHTERLDAGLIKSNFKQVFGRFNGTVRCGENTLAINNMYGFAEDQYAKW